MNFIVENFSSEAAVFILAMLPISELRGAIPLGMGLGMDPWKCYFLAVAGNIIIVPVLLKIFRPLIRYIARTRLLRKTAGRVVDKVDRNAQKVLKYELIGLFLLVAVPLPTTGAWTGCGVASFLKLDYLKSLGFISLGIMTAGLIVMALSFIGFGMVS
jgi:uncharacterized membrane protein